MVFLDKEQHKQKADGGEETGIKNTEINRTVYCTTFYVSTTKTVSYANTKCAVFCKTHKYHSGPERFR